MLCDVCQRLAIGYCRQCNACFCAEHGSAVCFRCSGAFEAINPVREIVETNIYTTEKDSRNTTPQRGYLQCTSRKRIPTVYLDDDDGLPMCYQCDCLAKYHCRNCQASCCADHRCGELCRHCEQSSRLGLFVFLAVSGFLGLTLYLVQLAS